MMLQMRKTAAPRLSMRTLTSVLLVPISVSVGIDFPTLMSLVCAARSVGGRWIHRA